MKWKKAVRLALILIVVVMLVHIASAVTLDKHIEFKNLTFYSAKLPAEMDGYRIAFMTDLHAISVEDLQAAVRGVNDLRPDLLLLGGDFSPSAEGFARTLEIISGVAATDGIYGVEGNHDNAADLFAAMETFGIHPLSNSGVQIRQNFFVAGVEDLWNRSPNIDKAVENAQPDDFVLLVAHNPDITMLQDTKPVDLILSGHIHGGQITLFGLWAPALISQRGITAYGQRFMSGWAKSRDDVPVYVSNGMGTFSGVPRIFARPQVILLTLRVPGA